MLRVATGDLRRGAGHEQRRGWPAASAHLYQGLVFWSPNINIVRDPRWGRGQETYGEDPFLTGAIGTAFVKGMQGDDPRYLKTVATAKHYAVHSGPESLRHSLRRARQRERPARDVPPGLPRPGRGREGRVGDVLLQRRSAGSRPAAATQLLGGVLRKEWGFSGYVVSDCGAVHRHPRGPQGPEDRRRGRRHGAPRRDRPRVRRGLLGGGRARLLPGPRRRGRRRGSSRRATSTRPCGASSARR